MVKISTWLSSQYQRYVRVWKLLKKPTMAEFSLISKVTAAGLLIIGAMGFVIATIMAFFF